MAAFHFELTSPEKSVFSGPAEQVDLPGRDGDFGVLAGHRPTIASLRPGLLTVSAGKGVERYVVLGGLAEVTPAQLTVLADIAQAFGEFDIAGFRGQIDEMEHSLKEMSPGDELDRAIIRLDHYKTLHQQLRMPATAF
ncbi:F0F1 ATP synthase subunit epsilon [Bradyrhizobium sp. SYSU BS000235]|uniref:F0F1 ATP synthase subunit epsilon n=1 Tax=Bradyrhizobium sp. SYSU BS000235 TaxID=3411332 RepID=UPI003C7867CC